MAFNDMAERLLKEIREANILRSDNGQTQVTVSLDDMEGEPFSGFDKVETIISYADQALYCAKHAGRNRIYRYGQRQEMLETGADTAGSCKERIYG